MTAHKSWLTFLKFQPHLGKVSQKLSNRFSLLFSLLLLLSILVLAGTVNHFGSHRPLINDEAVELLQGTGIPLDRYYFFAPAKAYPEGCVDVIETLVPYLYRVLGSTLFRFHSQDEFIGGIRICFVAVYVVGVLLFSFACWRLWGGFWPLAGGLSLGLAGYTLILNQFLTRNGISILWSCAIVLLLVMWMGWSRQLSLGKKVWASALLALLLVLGCWTYTSFRIYAAALYAALFLDWLRFDRSPKLFFTLGFSVTLFVSALVAMVLFGGDSLMLFLQRGGYALDQKADYWDLFTVSLASPLYYATGQDPLFLVEDVHNLVGRPVLSPWLSIFFIAGWVGSWKWGGRFMNIIVSTYTLGMAVCALAGPNTKYLFVFFPFTILLSLWGLRLTLSLLSTASVIRFGSLIAVFLLFVVMICWELREVFVCFRQDHNHQRNAVTELLANTAVKYSSRGERVYVQPGLGFDIVMWKTRPAQRAGNLFVYASFEEFRESLEKRPPPVSSTLLIDYPEEVIPHEHYDWMTSKKITVVNIHDLK
jgi:hypothetical protein